MTVAQKDSAEARVLRQSEGDEVRTPLFRRSVWHVSVVHGRSDRGELFGHGERVEELTELLLGRPPRREVVASEGVAWEQETGLIRLVLRIAGGGTEILWFDAVSGLLMRCEERDAKGALRFDLRIKAYRDVSGALLGSDITILAADGVQVRLAYAKSELNPTLPAELFRLRNVMGVKEVRLGDRGHWR